MPSIFFLSLMNGAPWGGSEEIWYRTAVYCASRGWKVGCAAFDWKEKERKFTALSRQGCQVYPIPNKGRSKKNIVQRLQYKWTRLRQVKFCQSLPFHEYDMVVVNVGGFEITTPEWRDLHTYFTKYALVFHNYDERMVWSRKKTALLKKWLFGAKKNLFAAKRICLVLERQLQVHLPHTATIINPITFSPPLRPAPYPPLKDQCYIWSMFAALDVGRKAQDVLIEALAGPQWSDRNWVLYLYGEGNDRSYLESLITRHNLHSKIILRGHIDNVQQALEETHLVLQITHRDAMPISVVEALAMSRPVVVSRIGDMPEWVREKQNGWISSEVTVREINRTMEMAWNKKEDWMKMGINGFHLFKEKFPPSTEAHFLDQLELG